VCLPEETAWIRQVGVNPLPDPDDEPVIRRILPPLFEDRSVVVTTPGARVRKEGDAIRVDPPANDRKQSTASSAKKTESPSPMRVPLSELLELVVVGRVSVTVPAIVSCLENGAPVAFMTGWGRLAGLASPTLGNNVQLRIAQHRAAQDVAQSLDIARALVTGKLKNQRTLVRRNHPNLPPAFKNELGSLIRAVDKAESLEALLGIEGRGARVYFDALAEIVHHRSGGAFSMQGRTRRPPRDRVNALLSFGYGVLVKDLTAITTRIGFDPFVGFLHQPGYGRTSLSLDLMEEFRPLIVDSTVLRLVSEARIKPHQFRDEGGGVLLLPAARRAFLRALDHRKEELVTHPLFGYRLSYLRTMEVQARLLGRVLQGEADRYSAMITR
jgi:CRISPR-associated protein Cas1